MRKSKHHEYRQAYNAQAVVDAEGSQLILGARISQCASDRNELGANIVAIPAEVGRPQTALADNGYAHGDEVERLAENGIEVLVATGPEGRRRRHDFRPAQAEAPTKQAKAAWLQAMTEKLASEQGQALYQRRQQTVEPVLGKLLDNGRFEGTLGTLTVRARVNIVPVSAKTSDDQPDYRVYTGRFELGAGWSKTSDRGNDYVSLVLDDPSFAAPLYAALMPADEPDTHRLVWSRPKRSDN